MTHTPFALVGYHLYREGDADIPSATEGCLYDYVIAGNGVFFLAERPELRAVVPLTLAPIRGLAPLTPRVQLLVPRVPAGLVEEMLHIARVAALKPGGGLEVLLYLRYDDGWHLDQPPQRQTQSSVGLADGIDTARYAGAVVDVHSHPFALRKFSTTDDDADFGRFRFAALIADPAGAPSLHVRLAVYDVLMEVPAEALFELPDHLKGACDEESSAPA